VSKKPCRFGSEPEMFIVKAITLILLVFAGCKLIAVEAPAWLVTWLSRLL